MIEIKKNYQIFFLPKFYIVFDTPQQNKKLNKKKNKPSRES